MYSGYLTVRTLLSFAATLGAPDPHEVVVLADTAAKVDEPEPLKRVQVALEHLVALDVQIGADELEHRMSSEGASNPVAAFAVATTRKRAQGRTRTLEEVKMADRKRRGAAERRKSGREGEIASLHERITRRIVEQLKKGTPPWVKPWSCEALVGMPRNYVSNRPYSGVNVLLTWISALEHGFTDTRWLTANQISELGGTFKGQTATRILFAKSYARAAGIPEEETFFVHKAYNVFNIEQAGGVALEPEEPPPPFEARLEHAEAFITAQGVPIAHGGDRAFYSPSKDAINLPFPGSFTPPEAYYAVVLHELAHASGHPRRLNRPEGAKGSPEYAAEELVAELTAAFLCAELGIPAALHHTGYIGRWVELLENDPKAIFGASREASRAAAFLTAQARSVLAPAEAT